ncbi:MAG: RNA polymerase sigma factor [Mangrovibacterium sp.]
MKNDQEIWERFKNGDKEALSLIYFQYFHSMYQYGIKICDDPEFIKDCIQEVFFKLIKTGTKLGPTDNILFYLFRTLKNVIYKELEKNKKIEAAKIKNADFHTSFLLEDQIMEQERATLKEMALARALNTLDGRQREIIYLRYECGMSYEQICEIMQIKNDSARKLVLRAIRSLKTIIEEDQRSFCFTFN